MKPMCEDPGKEETEAIQKPHSCHMVELAESQGPGTSIVNGHSLRYGTSLLSHIPSSSPSL